MFSEQDVRSANKVAILGKTVADQLFPTGDAVGSVIRVKAAPFTVVGVLTGKGLSVQGQDQDDFIIIPYTSLMKRIQGTTTLRGINISTASPKDLDSVQNQITQLLRQRHRTSEGSDDFTVRNQQELAEAANNASATMRILLAAVAFVSLVVGGIGIMNIMLVSVTERTREIGIRMAVGAHGIDILTQFLTEAVTLSIIGGGLGIAFGCGGSAMLAKYMGWATLTPVDWIIISFFGSGLVGILAGLYPAWKASQLDPIDALRYE
jgi:putative ABC transport system permease protein